MGKSIPSSFARLREKYFYAVRAACVSPRSGFGFGSSLQRRHDRNKIVAQEWVSRLKEPVGNILV